MNFTSALYYLFPNRALLIPMRLHVDRLMDKKTGEIIESPG
jgi:hypothetical protein